MSDWLSWKAKGLGLETPQQQYTQTSFPSGHFPSQRVQLCNSEWNYAYNKQAVMRTSSFDVLSVNFHHYSNSWIHSYICQECICLENRKCIGVPYLSHLLRPKNIFNEFYQSFRDATPNCRVVTLNFRVYSEIMMEDFSRILGFMQKPFFCRRSKP
jgi:hypothetical protein